MPRRTQVRKWWYARRGCWIIKLIMLTALLAGCSSLAVEAAPVSIPALCIQYQRLVTAEGRATWGTTAPISMFGGQIAKESSCRAWAQSKYAAGLTQFTSDTVDSMVQWYRHELNGCSYPFNAPCAIRAQVLYDLRLWLRAPTAADRRNRQAMTLVQYNAGPGWWDRETREARRRGLSDAHWFGSLETVCLRAAWACRESVSYVYRILDYWVPAFQLAGWG